MTNRLTFYDLVTIVVISITKYTAVLLMFNLFSKRSKRFSQKSQALIQRVVTPAWPPGDRVTASTERSPLVELCITYSLQLEPEVRELLAFKCYTQFVLNVIRTWNLKFTFNSICEYAIKLNVTVEIIKYENISS